MTSILFVSAMFGIPSGPGVLYGLRERVHLLIWSLEILGSGAALSGNLRKLGSGGGGGGLGGKNTSESVMLFCSLDSARVSCPLGSTQHRDGILVSPASEGVPLRYLFAVQMLGSLVDSNHSIQCWWRAFSVAVL